MLAHPSALTTEKTALAAEVLGDVVGKRNRSLAGVYLELVKRYRAAGDTENLLATSKVADGSCRFAFGKSSEAYHRFLVSYLNDVEAAGHTKLATRITKKIAAVHEVREKDKLARAERAEKSRRSASSRRSVPGSSSRRSQSGHEYALEAANEAAARFEMQSAEFLGAIGGGPR